MNALTITPKDSTAREICKALGAFRWIGGHLAKLGVHDVLDIILAKKACSTHLDGPKYADIPVKRLLGVIAQIIKCDAFGVHLCRRPKTPKFPGHISGFKMRRFPKGVDQPVSLAEIKVDESLKVHAMPPALSVPRGNGRASTLKSRVTVPSAQTNNELSQPDPDVVTTAHGGAQAPGEVQDSAGGTPFHDYEENGQAGCPPRSHGSTEG